MSLVRVCVEQRAKKESKRRTLNPDAPEDGDGLVKEGNPRVEILGETYGGVSQGDVASVVRARSRCEHGRTQRRYRGLWRFGCRGAVQGHGEGLLKGHPGPVQPRTGQLGYGKAASYCIEETRRVCGGHPLVAKGDVGSQVSEVDQDWDVAEASGAGTAGGTRAVANGLEDVPLLAP